MFPIIEKIIKDGNFSGCNINIKTTPSHAFAAVFTFLKPVSATDSLLANNTDNKAQLDNAYALRSALTRPLTVIDEGKGLDAAVEQALSNISESVIEGAKVLSAIDMAGLIEEATTKAKQNPIKKVATKASKADAKNTEVQPTDNADEKVESTIEESPTPVNSWETDLESL